MRASALAIGGTISLTEADLPDSDLPAPPFSSRLTGHLPQYSRDALGFFTSCARDYGDFVPLRFGPIRAFAIHSPELIEQVLVTDYRKFTKGNLLRRNRMLFGNGLLVSEGDFWRRQRKLAQPAFHRERINAYGKIMIDCAEEVLLNWKDGETRDVHAEMMRLTLEIVTRTLFSAGAGDAEAEKVGRALHDAQESVMKRMRQPIKFPDRVPTPANRQLGRAVRVMDSIIYEIIRERRESGEHPGDLLDLLLQVRDEDDGTGMSDKQLRDEALTVYLAGHETTALALTYVFYLLARNPEADRKLTEELDSVLSGRPPEPADRARLPYAEAVLTEAMRLYPPVWAVARNAIEDYELGGHRIPAKGTVITTQWAMHHDPRYFDNPEKFRPERWANDFAKTLPKYAYFPFGGGPRVCIGNTFALMEGILLLAAIRQRFQLRLVSDAPLELLPAITLRPKHGVMVRLSGQPGR